MWRAARRTSLLVLGLVSAACPPEDFGVAEPGPAFPVVDDATIFEDAATPGLDVLSGVEYVPTVRRLLAQCVGCHGDEGPIDPPLHTYVTARNAINDVLRALEREHDGDYSDLLVPCRSFAGVTGLGDEGQRIAALVAALRAWQAEGFRPGPPATPEEPPPLPAPDASFTVAPITSASPRCHRLGDLAAGHVSTVRVTARGVAWLELVAVAPPLAPLLDELEAADAAPGWDCDDALGLVPQPLVAAWQLGDDLVDLSARPLHVAASTLVVRAHGSFLEPPAEGPSIVIDLWMPAPSTPGITFTPLSTLTSLELPWIDPTGATSELSAVYSTPSALAVSLSPSACLHRRATPADWPELSLLAVPEPIGDGTRLELTCPEDTRCAAQIALPSDGHAEPCNTATATCRAACDDDLACTWTCAAEAGRRCALCVLTSQLACRSEACTPTARDRLESCAGADTPATCIAGSVLDALAACPATPRCAPALEACFPAP
ncbi:MAG: hypothetical protein IT385_07380 [Deltaproteobacteria bacterium]|nr:hypothetical protein [Deltaproteobacteria bacterium]